MNLTSQFKGTWLSYLLVRHRHTHLFNSYIDHPMPNLDGYGVLGFWGDRKSVV